MRILLGLVLGVALGYVCLHSGSALLSRVPGIFAPAGTWFINAIRVCVIPLVTSSLVLGCARSRDAGGIGRLAGRSLALVLGYVCVAAAFAGVAAFVIFGRIHGVTGVAAHSGAAGSSANGTIGLGAWMSDLIPANIFKAASDGALLPLIVASIAVGLAIPELPTRSRDLLLALFQAIAQIFTRMIDLVLRTAPIGVFCLAVPLAATTSVSGAGAVLGYIVVLSLVCAAYTMLVVYPSVALFAPVSIAAFVRAAAPAQAIAFTSRSSLAALPATYAAAQEGLAIPDAVTSFFFPFAASIFRVGGCMAQMVGICFLASFYGVALSWGTLAAITLSAVAVSFTVPGIPGGAIIVMTPILSSAGIPLDGVAMLLAVDTIPDMFRTLANVTGWLAAAAILSPGTLTTRPAQSTQAERDPSL